jgi:hypothetical protein
MKSLTAMATLLVAVLLLSGCATTKFKDTWKNPQLTHKVKRVYLIGITRYDKMRQLFETELVRQLAAYGVTGIPSYPDLVISGDVDREALRARLRAQGTDAVLVARIAGREQKAAMYSGAEAGYTTGEPVTVYYDEYYNSSVTIVTTSPAVESQFQVINISTKLFETESAKVIWSALTESTVGDDNRNQRLREFAEIFVKKLQEEGLL